MSDSYNPKNKDTSQNKSVHKKNASKLKVHALIMLSKKKGNFIMKEKLLAFIITTIFLSGCNSSSNSETSNNKTTNAIENTVLTTGNDLVIASKQTENTNTINATNNTIAYQPAQSTGRLLASNCFQCHATNGTGGFERITGGEAYDVYKYTTKTANANIMAAHAQGYTSTQLTSLIGYLNQL